MAHGRPAGTRGTRGLAITVGTLLVAGSSGCAEPPSDVGTDAAGQDTLIVSSAVACADCTIEVTHVARLGAVEDSVGPGDYVWGTRDTRGNFFVGPAVGGGSVLRYGADGRLDGLIGRAGEGPGEFRLVGAMVVGVGDSLHVFDRGWSNRSTFAPSGEYVSSTPLIPMGVDHLAYFSDGTMVVAGSSQTSSLVGYPAVVLRPDGQWQRPIGAVSPLVGTGQSTRDDSRSMGPGRDRTIWLAHFNRYRLEQWDLEGRLIRVLDRDAEWFQPWPGTAQLGSGLYEPPRPSLREVWQDDDGVVWTVTFVADAEWQPREDPGATAPGAEGGGVPEMDERDQIYDAIIEAIEPTTGSLLASTRVPYYLPRLAVPGLLIGRSGDGTGMVFVDFYEPRLLGRTNEGR